MKTVSVIDTSVNNYNLGNLIIMDSINNILDEIFSKDFIFKIQASESQGKTAVRNLLKSNLVFFGGTNALTSNINQEKYIGFSLNNLLRFNSLILLGVGWWQYQNKPNSYSRFFLRRLLDDSKLHSVRDSYTESMLRSIGINNVLNTSCPTTWDLNENHCKNIPSLRSDGVIFTLTDYNKHPKYDFNFIQILQSSYSKIFFWPQGEGDINYLSSLNVDEGNKIIILPPNLRSFNSLLKNYELDYIGTRLHAGIRALQYKKRSLILSIDNRSTEIANDININICPRSDAEGIKFFIENKIDMNIKIRKSQIEIWKNQFVSQNQDSL
jgi:polysaccharide pyruvyl transferase WcaK-like protein